MKSRDIIFKEARTILADILEKKESKIFEDSSFADFGLDSLDMANIIVALNEHFKIDLKHDDVDMFTTIENLIDLIKSILNEKEV